MTCVSSVLIVGGGIAGLSSAIALTRVGVRCEVVEKGDPTVGASIGFAGRATDALVELGLYDRLAAAGTVFPHDSQAIAMRDSAGNLIAPGPQRPSWPGAKEVVGIYRPTLFKEMTKAAEELGVVIRQGITFTNIDNRADGVSVTLTDDEVRDYDLLIGADGIGSATRVALFPGSPEPTYCGQISIRWMAPGPRVEPESWYASPVGRVGFYYLPEGMIYVPSVFNIPENKWMSDEEVYVLFSKLLDSYTAPAIVELRRRLKSGANLIGRPFRWILLPEPWYRDRALLIGDAAHATTAHMGMGGGMALEDAVVLAQCIRDAGMVGDALAAFMKRRFERCATVVRTSVRLSQLEQEHAPPSENMALLTKAFATISQIY
jgi:2-polyprenyl-6-methoxyphenol hydroxylase-like FAD-dependent oxidoreductase